MPTSYIEHNKFAARTQDPPALGSYLQPSSSFLQRESYVILNSSINEKTLLASYVTQSSVAQSNIFLKASFLHSSVTARTTYIPLSALLNVTESFQISIPFQSPSTTIDATRIRVDTSNITADRT